MKRSALIMFLVAGLSLAAFAQLEIIDGLIANDGQIEANAYILRYVEQNYLTLDLDLANQLFARYKIELDENPVATIETISSLLMTAPQEKQDELMPVIQAIKAKYGLSVIQELIAEGKRKQANIKIIQWMHLNAKEIDLKMAQTFLPLFSIADADNPTGALRQLARLEQVLTSEQKQELMPVMTQIKSKYDLLREKDEEEILPDVPSLMTNIVEATPMQLSAMAVDSVALDTVTVDGAEFEVVTVDGAQMIFLTVADLDLDLTDIPPNVMVVLQVTPLTVADLDLDLTDIPPNVMVVLQVDIVDPAAMGLVPMALSQANMDAWEIAFRVKGLPGYYRPIRNSWMDHRWRRLQEEMENCGGSWADNPAVRKLWKEYWADLQMQLRRRQHFKNELQEMQ